MDAKFIGPFDGVLGFSQGAAVAAALAFEAATLKPGFYYVLVDVLVAVLQQ